MDDLVLRELEPLDYYHGYINLMNANFPNYQYNLSFEGFTLYLNEQNRLVKILVLYDTKQKRVIGAGTIFILNKIHNYSVGQIEDVVISDQYRGKNLGKRIIDELSHIGMTEFSCYKIILNCSEQNIGFYKKCDFYVNSISMRRDNTNVN